MKQHLDIILAFSVIHGGAYHALLRFQELLRAQGYSTRLLLGVSTPYGLQPDLDLDDAARDRLEADGVRLLTDEGMLAELERNPARLFIFDSYGCEFNAEAVSRVQAAHGAATMQIGFLTDDFRYAGADHVVMQHPMTLWFVMEHYKRHTVRTLHNARTVSFAGNLQYEPLPNTWTSRVESREAFCEQYGLDAAKPIVLWLPDQEDGGKPLYGEVVDRVRDAGCSLVVKMHPWEYKRGYDSPWGEGVTSAAKWGVPAICERDATWARKFCDAAVVSGSSSGLELALWRKPIVYVDPTFWCSELVRACSRQVRGAKGLERALDTALNTPVAPATYAAVRRGYMPEEDSFALHLDCVARALGREASAPRFGNPDALRLLYRGRVPWWLKSPGRQLLMKWRKMAG